MKIILFKKVYPKYVKCIPLFHCKNGQNFPVNLLYLIPRKSFERSNELTQTWNHFRPNLLLFPLYIITGPILMRDKSVIIYTPNKICNLNHHAKLFRIN